nr:hypothetical protein Iba_chr09dCG5180 [Ipomoea batatas]
MSRRRRTRSLSSRLRRAAAGRVPGAHSTVVSRFTGGLEDGSRISGTVGSKFIWEDLTQLILLLGLMIALPLSFEGLMLT